MAEMSHRFFIRLSIFYCLDRDVLNLFNTPTLTYIPEKPIGKQFFSVPAQNRLQVFVDIIHHILALRTSHGCVVRERSAAAAFDVSRFKRIGLLPHFLLTTAVAVERFHHDESGSRAPFVLLPALRAFYCQCLSHIIVFILVFAIFHSLRQSNIVYCNHNKGHTTSNYYLKMCCFQ